ncbi:MAG: hypothetical protein R3F39_05210 [Myxococcota bacterium]
MLGPSSQAKVLRALAPYGPGAAVVEGWTIGDVALSEDQVRVALRSEGAAAALLLAAPDTPGERLALTASFAVRLEAPTPPPPGLDAAAATIIAALQANDRGGIWMVIEDAPTGDAGASADGGGPSASTRGPPPPAPAELVDLRLLLVLILALALALALSDRRALTLAIGQPTRAPAALAALSALFAVAVLARELLGPMTFLHENAHGVFRLEQFAGLVAERRPMAGQTALQQLVATITPPSVTSVTRVTAWLAALQAPLTALTARALGLRPAASLLAGLLVALLPLHIRISASEDAFPVAATWLTAATFAAAVAARSRSFRWLAASLLFVAGAGHFRPAMYAAGLPIVLAIPLVGGPTALRAALRSPMAWFAPLLFFVAAADDIAAIATALGGPVPLTAGWWRAPSIRSWPLLDPDATPRWLPAVAAAGLIWALATPRLRGAALWLALLLASLSFVYTSDNGWPAALRYSVAYAFVLVLAAALAVDLALARVALPRWRLALAALAVVAAGWSLAARAPFVSHRYAQQRELDFQFSQVLPQLLSAPPGVIVTPWPDLNGMQGTLVTTHLREAGYRVVDPSVAQALLADPKPDRPLYWYRGLACYARPESDPEVRAAAASACEAVEALGPWEPLAEAALEPDSDADWIRLGDRVHPVHVGLYRRATPR